VSNSIDLLHSLKKHSEQPHIIYYNIVLCYPARRRDATFWLCYEVPRLVPEVLEVSKKSDEVDDFVPTPEELDSFT